MFQADLKNSRIKYGKNFLEFLKSPVQLLDKTPVTQWLLQIYTNIYNSMYKYKQFIRRY